MWAGLVTIYGGARELAKLVWAETNKIAVDIRRWAVVCGGGHVELRHRG